jgi:hypothetical protein
MSVIPLSAAVKDGLAPDLDRVPDSSDERPGTFQSESFDKHFAAAWDKAEQDNSKPTDAEIGGQIIQPKGLDAKLKANFERSETLETERAEFNSAREARRELNERYGAQGDIATTIDMFVGWADRLRASPGMAAQEMAEAYMRASPWALRDKKETPPVDDPYGRKKLDAILGDAIENASAEKKDFEATAAQRAKLKQIFPGMTFDEALARVVQIDREMHQDPLTTAGKLGAAFGMPVTPRQAVMQQHVETLGAAIDRALPSMPGFQIEPVMNVLRDPNFPRTGDPVTDVRAAHELVQHQAAYARDLGHLAKNYIEHLGPELGGEVQRVIQSDAFKRVVANSPADGLGNLQVAIGMAQERVNTRSVSKARRAAPVKSRSTHTSKNSSSGLDAIIGNAIARHL